MQTRTDIARQFKTIRRRRKLTQVQLANQVGLHQRQISRVESGVTDPRLDTLLTLAAGLGARVLIIPDEDADLLDMDLGTEADTPPLTSGASHLLVP